MVRKLILTGAALSLAWAQAGCGSANFNKIFGSTDEGSDTKLSLARAAYDRGDFDAAEEMLTDLVDRNEDNEGAAILLGYTYLSAGGIDPFQLARKLIEISAASAKKTATAATTLIDDERDFEGDFEGLSASDEEDLAALRAFMLDDPAPTTGTGTSSGTGSTATSTSSSTNASSTLLQLGSIINLTADDIAKLKKEDYPSTSGLFKDAPLIVPNEVTDALRASISVLNNMNKAVKLICRFVDTDTKVDGDPRVAATSCAQTTIPRKQSAKAHFLWAFSHLTEAMVYQSVLLYSTVATGTSNFEAAGAVINTFSGTGAAGIAEFVAKVTDLKKAVDTVFDVGNPNSMISNTLRDILAVNKAFTALSGLPKSMTASITKALEKLEEIAKQFGGGTATVDGQTKALKGQMIEKFSKTVGSKINDTITKQMAAALPAGVTAPTNKAELEALAANPALSDEQKAKVADVSKIVYGDTTTTATDTGLCGAYGAISDGLPTETVTSGKPGLCP